LRVKQIFRASQLISSARSPTPNNQIKWAFSLRRRGFDIISLRPDIGGDENDSQGLVVLYDADDPNSEAFWLLDMTAAELERWWPEREECWWPVTEEAQIFSRTMAEDPELAETFGTEISSLRPAMVLPGRFLPCWPTGSLGQESTEASILWMSFYESKRHHYCRLCCDADSLLTAPDGRRIYHKGYRGDRR